MKRFVSILLAFFLTFSISTSMTASAATGTLKVNSATRHVLCEELSQQALDYYTGEYTYENLSRLSGAANVTDSYAATQNNPLYDALHDLMADTHVVYSTYSGYGSNALATYWGYTDAEAGEHGYLYFYTDVSSNDVDYTMNREHVWPKSRASFYQKNGGADLHHLRPSISTVNFAKSNYAFGNVVGQISGYSTAKIDGVDVIWYSGTNDLLEVRDNIKGDVARIMLYVWCRWEQPNLYSNVNAAYLPPMDSDDSDNNGKRVFESLDTLLAWMEMDPVDEWEMERNDQTENVQGNRNVFIDYPELAFLVFGQEIPADMPTPSNPDSEANICRHENTEIRDAVEPTCTVGGYTGDSYCTDCGELLEEGTTIPALGHDYQDRYCTRCGEEMPCDHADTELRGVVEASCTEAGYTGDSYCADCGKLIAEGEIIEATGHSYVDGVCTVCGETESVTPGECYFDDFSDCKDKWYHEAVDYAVANSLMNGVGEGKFDPSGSMTRAMIVTVLYRAAGSPEVAEPSTFTDVLEGQWYSDAIAWAQDNGIVNGISETEFAPMANVTREQIAAILWRYVGSPEAEADLSSFKDVGSISGYAVDAITWAVSEGILNGDNGNLKPVANATRAEFACIIMRFLGGSYDCENLNEP